MINKSASIALIALLPTAVLAATVTIGSSGNDVISSPITGPDEVDKEGSGTTTLTGTNTYTGGTFIDAGTLAIGAGGSLWSSGTVSLTAPGTGFDISAGGNQTIGALNGVAGSTVTLGSNVLTLGGFGDGFFDGIMAGTGGLIKNGAGIQELGGANTYSGGTVLNTGGLLLGNDNALGTGALTINGNATLDTSAALNLANDVDLSVGANLNLLGSNALTLGGVISGGGGLIKNGAATVTLTNANTYTGGTTINAGTLAIGAGGSLLFTGAVNLAGTGTFDVSAAGNQVIGSLAGVVGSIVSLGGNTLILNGVGDTAFAGAITGNGGLVKDGAGVQTLNGASTFNGGVVLNAGGLVVGNNAALGTGALTVGGAATLDSNAAITLANNVVLNAGLTVLGSNGLTLNGNLSGTGGLTKDGNARLTLNGTNTYTGDTSIEAGTLALGAGASLAASGIVDIATGATFDISAGNGTQSFGTLTGTGTVNLGANSLVVGDFTNTGYSVSFAGTGGLIKQGAGTVTLTGANTYTGGTVVNAGTLVIGAGGSLAATGTVSLAGPGAGLDISNAGNQAIGPLSGVAGTTVTLGGNTLALGGAGNTTFSGNISGGANGALVKNGTGVQTLNGSSTFGGGVTLNAGGLVVGSNSALGTGALTVDGAATLDANSAVVLANNVVLNAGLTVLGTNDLTLDGDLSGTGGLTKDGNARLTLNGSNTYTGDTDINAGTLALGAGASLSTSGIVNLATGATFDLSAGNGTQTFGTLVGDGTIVLGVNSVTVGDSSDGTYSGSIGGLGGLIKEGSGTETLTGTNTYTGGTIINAGTLAIGAGGSLAPNGAVNLAASGTGFDISGGGNQSIGVLNGTAGSTVTLGGNTLTLDSANNGVFDGVIAGTGGLVKSGNGTQTLGGANTYTGGTVINAGTLALAAGGSLAATGAVNLAGPAAFDISAAGNQTIGALAGVAGSTVALGGNTLTVNGADGTTFDGVIAGTGGVVKNGTGTLILNAVNTYSGGTSILGGTFEVGDADHPGASILGDVSVGSAGTLRGHGTIDGNVVNNGTVRPGGSIGTLTVTGNYTQLPSGTLFIDVSPSGASQLKVGGTATLAGTLNVLYGPGTYSATSYRILDASSVSGQFSSITGNTPANFVQDVQTQANGSTLTLSPQDTGNGGTVVVAPTNATIFGAIGSAAIREGQRVNETLLSRLGQACADAAAAADCARPGQQAWAQVVSNTAHVRGNDEAPSYEDSHYGFLAGIDRQAGAWTVGVAGGYSHVDVSEDEASGKIDTVRLAGYGSRRVGPVDVAATVGVAYDFLNSRRSFNGLDSARGNTDGEEITAGLQASLPMATGPVIVTPRLGLRYQYFHAASFDETGSGSQNLDVHGQDISSLQPYAQLSMGLPFHTGADKPALVEARVGYAYETLDAGRDVNASASDGTRFSLPGVAPSRGMLSAGLGVTLPVGKAVDVSASYDRLFNTGNVSAQVFQLQASYRF